MIRRLVTLCLLLTAAFVVPVGAQQPPFSQAFTFQNAATVAGNGAVMNTGNFTVLGLQVVKTGTFVGTVNPEGSIGSSTTWSAIPCYPQGSSTASTAPDNGIFRCSVIGVTRVRMRLSSVTTGTGTGSVYGFGTQMGPMPVNVP
jgi:hypothetical protein